jgi:hypothetical protein
MSIIDRIRELFGRKQTGTAEHSAATTSGDDRARDADQHSDSSGFGGGDSGGDGGGGGGGGESGGGS